MDARDGGSELFKIGDAADCDLAERVVWMFPILFPLVVAPDALSNVSVTLCLSDDDIGERDLRFSGGDAAWCVPIGDR